MLSPNPCRPMFTTFRSCSNSRFIRFAPWRSEISSIRPGRPPPRLPKRRRARPHGLRTWPPPCFDPAGRGRCRIRNRYTRPAGPPPSAFARAGPKRRPAVRRPDSRQSNVSRHDVAPSTTAVVGSAVSSRMRASRCDGSIIGCGRPWVNWSSPMSIMVFSRLLPSLGNGELPVVGVLENALIPAAAWMSCASKQKVPPEKTPRT